MQPAVSIMIFVLQISLYLGQRPVTPSKKNENSIEKIQVKDNFNPNQFSGKWFLIGVASECEYLKENNHRLDATVITISPRATEKKTLPVSTFRKLDGLCWEIKQEYQETKVPGRFILKARGYKSNVDVLVADTNYSVYAILYYQKQRKISIKLYARNENVADNIIQKFEQRISDMGIPEDFIYYFPKYGFCHSADQFHILKA